MIRKHVFVSEGSHRDIKIIAAERGTSITKLVEEAWSFYKDEHAPLKRDENGSGSDSGELVYVPLE